MRIQRVNSTQNQNFTANFAKNQNFYKVVEYAEKNNCLTTLDAALHALSKANKGTIKIIDGETSNGRIYSTFMIGRRAVPNQVTDAKSPAEASFDAILNLSLGGRSFRDLFGSKMKQNITFDDIIKEYTL